MRLRVAKLGVLVGILMGALACGAAPPPPPPPPPKLSVEALARDGLERELRRLGWQVEPSARELVASRGAIHYAIGLAIETSDAAEGPKMTVRLSLFDASNHSLQGEVSSWAIAPGETSSEAGPHLAPMLGKHAADKLQRLADP